MKSFLILSLLVSGCVAQQTNLAEVFAAGKTNPLRAAVQYKGKRSVRGIVVGSGEFRGDGSRAHERIDGVAPVPPFAWGEHCEEGSPYLILTTAPESPDRLYCFFASGRKEQAAELSDKGARAAMSGYIHSVENIDGATIVVLDTCRGLR